MDLFAEQRQAKRDQAAVYDLFTPPRRGDVVSPRTCEVGVQATVDMCVIDTQTETSLPNNVSPIWHCQTPTSVIDMSSTQAEDADEDRDEEDDASSSSEVPPPSDEHPGQDSIGSPAVIMFNNDASREVAFHPPDEAGGSRNVPGPATEMEIDDVMMLPNHIDDDPMSPGHNAVSSTQAYLSDIEAKPATEYLMGSDIGDRLPIVTDLTTSVTAFWTMASGRQEACTMKMKVASTQDVSPTTRMVMIAIVARDWYIGPRNSRPMIRQWHWAAGRLSMLEDS